MGKKTLFTDDGDGAGDDFSIDVESKLAKLPDYKSQVKMKQQQRGKKIKFSDESAVSLPKGQKGKKKNPSKKSKKTRFSDDDDEEPGEWEQITKTGKSGVFSAGGYNDNAGDLDIDIRDEEEEDGMGGPVDKDEVESYIRKLGLDKFDDQGYEEGMESNEEGETRPKSKKEKRAKKDRQKGGELKAYSTETGEPFGRTGKSVGTTREKAKKKKGRGHVDKDIPVQDDEVSSSSPPPSNCTIKLTGKWYDEKLGVRIELRELPDDGVSKYESLAKTLYENEVAIYEKERLSKERGHAEWMKTVVTSGVLSDKVAALGLQIQESPVHTLQYLEHLLTMARKKGRREAGLAIDALRHLFLEELIPTNRKLRRFERHVFDELDSLPKEERDRCLIFWHFEGQLKTKYEDFVNIHEMQALDTVSAVKAKAITTMYELLVNKPELEQKLLYLLVNKLGDPDYKIATKVVHWLKSLVKVHPSMNEVVVREVEQLLYKQNVTEKTKYYCVCFLNQLLISQSEAQLATKLITIYFKYFNLSLDKKSMKEGDHKMLSALLTGVNRAYPFSRANDEEISKQIDLLFKVAQQSDFNTGLQALMLLKQVLASRQSMSDRFYSSLYRKLLDTGLAMSPQKAMFLNLLYQALRDDTDLNRIKAFVKRILQICHGQSPNVICGLLFLVSEIRRHQDKLDFFSPGEEEESDEEEHFEDVPSEGDDEEEGAGTSDDDAGTPLGGSAAAEGTLTDSATTLSASSWVHKKKKDVKSRAQSYDALARNPAYSGAERSIPWELNKLCGHFHPSVSQFASTLLAGERVVYDGNPLDDFILMRFLDRFVFKNPKADAENTSNTPFEKKHSSSLAPLDSKKILTLPKENIPLDLKFFHQYFSQKKELADEKQEQSELRKKERGEEEVSDVDSQASSVEDQEFEEFIEGEMEDLMEQPDSDEDDAESDSEEDKVIDDFEKFKHYSGVGKDMDFAGDISSKKDKKRKHSESSEEGESSGGEGAGDEEDDGAEEEDTADKGEWVQVMQEGEEEFDEEGFGSDEDERKDDQPVKFGHKRWEEERAAESNKKKKGKKKMKKKTTGAGEDPELLETADKFSSLIDATVSSKFDHMSMQALSNKDKAHHKQLQWEVDRDKWIRGRDDKSIVAAKKKNKRHRWFSKKKGRGGGGGGKKK